MAGVVLVVFLALLGRSAFDGNSLVHDRIDTNDVTFVGSVYEAWALRVREGRLPLWFPEHSLGTPVAAAWMYGMLYPGLALFAVFPLGIAWAWTAALHVALGAAGMASFLRRRGHGLAGVAAGALLFGISEFAVGRAACGHLNVLLPVCWAPWVFRFADGAIRGEKRAVPLLGLALGLGVLSGHGQMWLYLAPLLTAFVLRELASLPRTARVGAFLRVSAGAATGLLIALPQLALTAQYLAQTGPVPIDREQMRNVSVPPGELLRSVFTGRMTWETFPEGVFDFRHEFRGIAGPLVLGLAIWGCIRGVQMRWFWAGAAALGAVLSLGEHTAFTAWLHGLPGIDLTRTPGRALVLPLLALPVLAAAGADAAAARTAGRPGARSGANPEPAPGGNRGGNLSANRGADPAARPGANPPAAPGGPGGANPVDGAAPAAVSAAGSVPAALAVSGLVLVHAVFLGVPIPRTVPDDMHRMDWASRLPPEVRAGRVHLPMLYGMSNLEARGLRTLREAVYLHHAGYAAVMSEKSPAIAWWLDLSAQVQAQWSRDRSDADPLLQPDAVTGVELTRYDAMGPARAFAWANVGAPPADVLRDMRKGDRTLHLGRAAAETLAAAAGWSLPEPPTSSGTASTGQSSAGQSSAGPASAGPSSASPVFALSAAGPAARRSFLGPALVRIEPQPGPLDTVTLRITLPVDAFVLVSLRHDTALRATLDGARHPLVPANLAFPVAHVPAGTHTLTLTYSPPGLPTTLLIAALTAAAAAAAAILLGRRRA